MVVWLNKHKVGQCNAYENMAMGLPAFARKLAGGCFIK